MSNIWLGNEWFDWRTVLTYRFLVFRRHEGRRDYVVQCDKMDGWWLVKRFCVVCTMLLDGSSSKSNLDLRIRLMSFQLAFWLKWDILMLVWTFGRQLLLGTRFYLALLVGKRKRIESVGNRMYRRTFQDSRRLHRRPRTIGFQRKWEKFRVIWSYWRLESIGRTGISRR